MKPIDALEIVVLVDNTTDSLSSNPGFVETEWAGHWRRGMPWLSGKCLCCAAHGLSCFVTARRGTKERTLLFDTGPEEWVFERNVVRLDTDLGRVDAMVLSHGHWDHAGAMPRALQMIRQRNGGRQGAHLHAPRHVRAARGKAPGWHIPAHGTGPQRRYPVRQRR